MQQRLRTEGIVLVPALAAIALLVYWAAHGGGYSATTWEPSALVVLGLLAATVVGLGLDRLQLSRPAAIALAALAAYTAWSYLSIAWAAAPGDALDGANRTLLYLLLFAMFALLPWRTWSALIALSTFALGIGVLAVVTLVRLGSADAPSLFIDGRLSDPVGYVNGTAALFLTGTIVAIALAAQRALPVALRGALLALATAALQISVLPESRGWLFALPIVLIAAVALVPGRVRFILWSLPPLAGTLVALPALLDVYTRVDASAGTAPSAARRVLVDAAGHAAVVALAATAVVLVVALGLALADRRASVSAGVARGADRVAVGLAIAAAVAGIVAGLVATHGRPDRTIADYWDRSSGYQAAAPGDSRFALAGSNRPDFWRVSLDAVADHPLTGLGQDNWGDYYLRHRQADEQPRWPHSLELRLLAHTGIVGFLLFAAFLAAAVVAALRGRRRVDRLANVAAAAALLPLVVWTVHGSIDWFWEIPAVSGPAFAFLGLGGALMRHVAHSPEDADPPCAVANARPASAPARLALGLGLGLCGLAAAVALALPYLAEREVAAASAHWVEDPARAFSQLDRAARLNPLSPRPELVAGVVALELGRNRLAETRFTDAIARGDGDWFAFFGRGLAASALGETARARLDYEHARFLDPHGGLVREALRRVDDGDPMTAGEAFRSLRRDVENLTSRVSGAATV